MKTFTLAGGINVPQIAFGSGTAHYQQECTENILAALEVGMRHIDTAQAYLNEESVGKAIATFLASHPEVKREDLFVTTKLYQLTGDESVEDSLRESLKKLQLDYVDSFLIHMPFLFNERKGGVKGVWAEMLELKKPEKGLAKTVGVSNFNFSYLKEISSDGLEAPAVNQVSALSVFGPAHAEQW